MAINGPVEEIALRLKKETTSKETKLKRIVVQDSETGFYKALFPVEIDIESITYVLDADNNKIGVYEQQPLGNESLTEAEIISLWSEPIALVDSTTTTIGEWISNKIDSIIAAKLGL